MRGDLLRAAGLRLATAAELLAEIDEATLRGVHEGIFYADRPGAGEVDQSPMMAAFLGQLPMPTGFGLYFTEGGSQIVSLAIIGEVFELYAMEGMPDTVEGVCRHDTMEEADACAVGAIVAGKWCTP